MLVLKTAKVVLLQSPTITQIDSMIFQYDPTLLLLISLAGLYAGTQNTLAGGGSFITFPTLLLVGLDPLSANITSTLALFPNQMTSSLAGRKLAGGVGELSLKIICDKHRWWLGWSNVIAKYPCHFLYATGALASTYRHCTIHMGEFS